MKISLKYLVEDTDRYGTVRIYVRRKGKKRRILAKIGTPEFMVEYNAALAELQSETSPQAATHAGPAAPGSLRWIVERYYGSAEYKRLTDRTRGVRRRLLDRLCEKHGTKPVARMEPRHVRALRDERADAPEAANGIVKYLRAALGWAVEAGYLQTNPARDVPYIVTGSEGHHTWTIAEVAQFEARHPIGSKARLAMALLLYTGVRRSDVVGLGPGLERGNHLLFTEVKGRSRRVKHRELPILPQLRAILDASPLGDETYLVTEFGKPFTGNGFGNWFRKRCDEAGLTQCSAHGLRKAGATIAANNGATEHQLMAIYGWDSPKQAALYTRRADRKRLADQAMHLLVPEPDTAPPTQKS